jgi:hypothetical protein
MFRMNEGESFRRRIKFPDLVFLQNAVFVYNFHSGKLLNTITNSLLLNQQHNYNTRLAFLSKNKISTNYGKFNIRYIEQTCGTLLMKI